ncbi:MAG: hypothetical protein ABI947_22840 [Chloroflexota bacterium]
MSTLYIFVTGPSGSGKTAFLEALGEPEGFWVDQSAGLEYRHIVVDDSLEVYLFCSIDPSRFDQLIEIPERDLLGYIAVIDSTDPESWEEAKLMVSNCRGYALLPTVLAANKQDLSGAYTPEEVGAWMGMDAMTSALGVVVPDPESARRLFLQLLYSVNQEIERLDALIKELERLAARNDGKNG